MQLRLRLTALYVGVLAVVLVLFGTATYIAFARNQRSHLDNVLENRAQEIGRASRFRSGGQLLRGLSVGFPGVFVQVLDPRSKVVVRSENLGQVGLPVDPGSSRVATGASPRYLASLEPGGALPDLRMLVIPLRDRAGGPAGAIQLAASLDEVDTGLRRLRLSLLVSGLGGLTAAAALGWRAARTALRPVDEMAGTAAEIGRTQDLTRRVSAGGQDEVGRLADEFNRMLDRLQRAREELENALEGQRRFLADVSHELRTPLTTMRGNLEVTLRNRSLKPLDRSAAIADALAEAERMSRMVEDLLALARTGSPAGRPHETVPLSRIVREAVDAARARANGIVVSHTEAGDPVIEGISDHVRRLVDNLLDNALKYTPEGEVEVSLAQDGRWAVLRVRDTGVGMTPEETERAFERFWRGDRARGRSGSGLGLAIARAVAESHGGTIALTSSPGSGSEFTVRLPLAPIPLRPLSDEIGTKPGDEEVHP